MDTTIEYFEQKHFVGHVLNGNVAEGLPTLPEEIDLRFLKWIAMGDTYDGDNNPSNGVAYSAVIYGNQIAWEEYADYIMGTCEQRTEAGNKLYFKLYFAARLYLKIQMIGRAMYFGEKAKRGGDVFYVNLNDLALLKEHPQYKQMVNNFGLELHPTKKEGCLRVVVTKFYEGT